MARPRRQFSAEEVQQITDMALDNCHLDTIAMALGIPKETLKRRFGSFIVQKRAEGRTLLRKYQHELSKTNPAMAIFLGKNVLDQTDKQDITQHGEGLNINIVEAKPALKLTKGA